MARLPAVNPNAVRVPALPLPAQFRRASRQPNQPAALRVPDEPASKPLTPVAQRFAARADPADPADQRRNAQRRCGIDGSDRLIIL